MCEDWGADHYYALAIPTDNFDCSLLEPVDDNSDVFADRADVVGACEACVEADCLNGIRMNKNLERGYVMSR